MDKRLSTLKGEREIEDVPLKLILIFIFILTTLLVFGCTRLNQNPPEYIKELVVYTEGYDNLIVYFILADKSGAMTTSEGTAKLTIKDKRSCIRPAYKMVTTPKGYKSVPLSEEEIQAILEECRKPLLELSLEIKKTDFGKHKIGKGAFEHKVILCPIGRIPYSTFTKSPYTSDGTVILEFQTVDGRTLKAREKFYF